MVPSAIAHCVFFSLTHIISRAPHIWRQLLLDHHLSCIKEQVWSGPLLLILYSFYTRTHNFRTKFKVKEVASNRPFIHTLRATHHLTSRSHSSCPHYIIIYSSIDPPSMSLTYLPCSIDFKKVRGASKDLFCSTDLFLGSQYGHFSTIHHCASRYM